MSKNYKFSVFIGRFQPFHLAHMSLLKEALRQAETAIVILGSYKRARNPKNPWTGEEREQMIRASLSEEENASVKFVMMRDYAYNDNLWVADLQQQVSNITQDSNSVALIGHKHDRSSYYLELFPQWTFVSMDNVDSLPHATIIRNHYFQDEEDFKTFCHPKTIEYLESFRSTEDYKDIKASFDDLNLYKSKWKSAPFPPIFLTVDSVVIKSGHLLLVRRKGPYGRGLLALPGGFLNQDEITRVATLRELKEETSIKLATDLLDASIVEEKVFQHPERSLRGRTVTFAYLINLGAGLLPSVKAADDAAECFWLPLRELAQREDQFFEDHFYIIQNFINKF